MSKQDNTVGNERSKEITRRATLTLAAAVATFGAAMGMRASPAWAQDRTEGKAEGKVKGESRVQSKAEGKVKGESKAEGKAEGKVKGESRIQGKAEGNVQGKAASGWDLGGKAKIDGKPSTGGWDLGSKATIDGKPSTTGNPAGPTKPVSPPAPAWNLNPAVRR
jgi:hypothetical protein